MKEIAPSIAWELMGKPKMDALETLAVESQRAFVAAKNILVREAQFALVTSIFGVMEWLDQQEMLKEGKSVMASVATQISELKNLLLGNERVRIEQDKTVYYELINSYGEAVQEMADTDSLAIAHQNDINMELLEGIANGDSKAFKTMKDIAKKVSERKARMQEMQKFVGDVARIMISGIEITFTQSRAELRIDNKSTHQEYRQRLKLLQDGKITTIDKSGNIIPVRG